MICFNHGDETTNITLAALANAISDRIRRGVFTKNENQSCEFKEVFVDKVRNGHFHIHMIETFEDAEHYYTQCSYYFRRCIYDINFTLP